MNDKLEALKERVRDIGKMSSSELDRSRRLYIYERPVALQGDDAKDYGVKREISEYFGIPYGHVHFAGSTQLGFSAHKDREFIPKQSDLDVACVSSELFQQAWIDVLEATNRFTNLSVFAPLGKTDVDLFKEQIYKRGMIRIEVMPQSSTAVRWRQFEQRISRKHLDKFKSVSIAIYMNEYAFCWKQNSAIEEIIGV